MFIFNENPVNHKIGEWQHATPLHEWSFVNLENDVARVGEAKFTLPGGICGSNQGER